MSVDKSDGRIRRMFAEISTRYDFLNHFLSGGTDFYWRWRTVRMNPPSGDAPILDVCTGTGDLAIAYSKRSKGRTAVVGTDFTHEMLQLANRKSAKLWSDDLNCPLSFCEADTQKLPFLDDQFQLVCVAFGLRNVQSTLGGLKEMARVCQTGGKVLVLEFSMPQNRVIRAVYQWYFRNILPRLGQLLARNQQSAYNYLPVSVSEFPQGDELADLMRQCGLEAVTWTPMTFGIATLYCGTKGQQTETD